MAEWLVDDVRPLDAASKSQIDRETPAMLDDDTRGTGKVPRLAVKLRNVICHDVQTVFGGPAPVRLDAVVVSGRGLEADPSSFYMPRTFRFPDIDDHVPLPIDKDYGLLIFDGTPLHFLDIFIMASRDRKGSKDVASLLGERLNDQGTKEALSGLLSLAMASPTAAVVSAAVAAAATIGELAYEVVKAVSPKTIGMYRGSFLQFRDGFGVNRHPAAPDAFHQNNLEFWYEILIDKPVS